jgi:biotin carboxyl carrier protein
MQLQAVIDHQTIDLEIDHGSVTVDGQPVEARVTRLNDRTIHLIYENRSYVLTALAGKDGAVEITVGGHSQSVRVKNERDILLERMGISADADLGVREVRAPMPGLVLQVMVNDGDEVEAGAGLLVLEAMKMENELRAPAGARVEKVHVKAGAAVGKNELLITFSE